MTSFGSNNVDYFLSKRYLPSSQVERVPNVDELEEETVIDTTGSRSSLRLANFLPPGLDVNKGSPASAAFNVGSFGQSPMMFSPVYAQLATIKSSKLRETSLEAQKLRRKLIRGSNVLIVQGGYSGKAFIYKKLKDLGVRVTIMDGPESFWKTAVEDGSIAAFAEIDFSDHNTVFERAMDIVMSLDTKFDAITTYYEDAVPLATKMGLALGFETNPIEACDIARNKRRTRQAMKEANLPTPAFCSIQSEADLVEGVEIVGFPAVLKPVFGASSLGVFKVKDKEETFKMYKTILETLKPDDDTIWAQGTEVILEEFYDGDEFDVDLLLCEGECVYAKMSDNWACFEPWFQETGLNMPSFYPKAAMNQLIKLAVDTTLCLGFRYGAFHVEVKYTSRGPRLVEVNARMGGVSVRDANLGAWGVDLVEEHCMAMLKIPIRPMPAEKFLKVYVSIGLISPCDGIVDSDNWLEEISKDPHVDKYSYEKKKGAKVTGPLETLPDWLGELRCTFASKEEMIQWINDNVLTMRVPLDKADENTKFFVPLHAYPFQTSLAEKEALTSP